MLIQLNPLMSRTSLAHAWHAQGSKVKVSMSFSGRELRFKDQGKELMLVRIRGCSDCPFECSQFRFKGKVRRTWRQRCP